MVSVRATGRGFTLVELMAALLLGSVVMLMVVGTVRTTVVLAGGSRVDEQRGRRSERARALLERQLAWISLDQSREARHFRAGPGWLELETQVSVDRPEHGDRVRARYDVVEDELGGSVRLVLREMGIVERSFDDLGREDRKAAEASLERMLSEAAARPVMEDLAHLTIEVLTYVENGERSWSQEWTLRTLPRAVRVTWTTKEGEAGRWVVPVEAMY